MQCMLEFRALVERILISSESAQQCQGAPHPVGNSLVLKKKKQKKVLNLRVAHPSKIIDPFMELAWGEDEEAVLTSFRPV